MNTASAAAAPERLKEPALPGGTSGLFQSSAGRTVLLGLLLIAGTLLSYNPVTHNNFVRYDDDRYIVDNPEVKAGLTWATVKWAFTTYEEANWHPLTWLSHALDCELFGVKPAGHHYMNVLLHAANAVLLFLLLQYATGFAWRSFMVAALFALHPINVESVAWAAERKNVLSMLFFLLALYAYIWYTRRPGLGRYAAVFFLFALALLSKPQVITFPFLLLLFDYWPLRRFNPAAGLATGAVSSERLILEKLPLLLLSAASAVVTMIAQSAGRAVKSLAEYSFGVRLETALVSYARYLGKAVWPTKLVALYPHPAGLYPAWKICAAVLLLTVITALVLRARDKRYLAVGWFWFLGSLVPMIGLVQVGFQAMADRYAYIPFVGLFVMVTWLAADEKDRVVATLRPARTAHSPVTATSRLWVAIPASACLLALGILTYRQVGYWHDTESFWLRTLSLTRDNYVAEDNLGEYLFSRGRGDEAAAHFRAALAIRPDGLVANLNLGAYEDRRGNWPEAIARYQVVATHAGDVGMRSTAYGSLGFVYRQIGDAAKAKECFERALQIAPDRARPMVGLGLLAQESGNLDSAVGWFSQAAATLPSDVTDLLLAQALQKDGREGDANAIYGRLAGSPNLARARREAQSLLSRN